jgi:hypothetical protein
VGMGLGVTTTCASMLCTQLSLVLFLTTCMLAAACPADQPPAPTAGPQQSSSNRSSRRQRPSSRPPLRPLARRGSSSRHGAVSCRQCSGCCCGHGWGLCCVGGGALGPGAARPRGGVAGHVTGSCSACCMDTLWQDFNVCAAVLPHGPRVGHSHMSVWWRGLSLQSRLVCQQPLKSIPSKTGDGDVTYTHVHS